MTTIQVGRRRAPHPTARCRQTLRSWPCLRRRTGCRGRASATDFIATTATPRHCSRPSPLAEPAGRCGPASLPHMAHPRSPSSPHGVQSSAVETPSSAISACRCLGPRWRYFSLSSAGRFTDHLRRASSPHTRPHLCRVCIVKSPRSTRRRQWCLLL